MAYSALQLQHYPEGTVEYLRIKGVPAGIRLCKNSNVENLAA